DGGGDVWEGPGGERGRGGLRGDVDEALPVGRGDDDLRRIRAVPGRRDTARGARREGVRDRLIARLGREGTEAPRCQGGDRRELRANPPLEPADDGDPAARLPPGREPRVARADR